MLQTSLFYLWVFVKNFFIGIVMFFILIPTFIKLTWLVIKWAYTMAFSKPRKLGDR